MMDEGTIEGIFQTSRLEKPMSQAELIFNAISNALKEEPGSRERTMRLADVQSLLAPQIYQDPNDVYQTECTTAKTHESDVDMDGIYTHADFQAEWLSAMMRLLKRSGLLGKEYVEG